MTGRAQLLLLLLAVGSLFSLRFLLVQALTAEVRQSACQEASYCEAPMPDVEDYLPLAPEAELVHVSLYLRHGDRTPLAVTTDHAVWGELVDRDSLLKLDPLYFPDEVPSIQGLLTIRGQQQLWRLGTIFRSLYGASLDSSSSAQTDVLEIYSTALSRTYLSAQAFLEGVYPQGHTVAIQLAPLPLPPTPADSPEGSIFEASDRHFCQACYPDLGADPTAEDYCRLARETFAARPIAPDPGEVAHLLQHSLRLLAEQDAMPPSAARASVLVAHDTTIVSLLSRLGATDAESQRWPPYAANLLIELWRQAGALAVRIIYNGRNLPLAWCSQPDRCPLLEFISHLVEA